MQLVLCSLLLSQMCLVQVFQRSMLLKHGREKGHVNNLDCKNIRLCNASRDAHQIIVDWVAIKFYKLKSCPRSAQSHEKVQ